MITTLTADRIRAAAHAYNAEFPEAAAEIEAGTPEIRVIVTTDNGTGWNVTATINAGINYQGTWIGTLHTDVIKFRKRDGRIPATEATRRRIARQFANAEVDVTYYRRDLNTFTREI